MFKTIRQASIGNDSFLVGESIRQSFSRSEVESMLDKREKDSHERGFREGHAQGREEGIAQARKEARDAVQQKLKFAEELILETGRTKEKIISQAQQDILDLALVIAARIVHKEIKESEVIRKTVSEAIKLASDRQSLKIRLNPAEVAMIDSFQSQLLEEIRGIKKIELIEDPEIIPGGCIVETSDGSVDARIDRQMEEIRKILIGG